MLLAPLLASIAGYVDGLTYLALQMFVANMTGATVLFGLAAAQLRWGEALSRAGVILCFLAGVIVSRLLRRLRKGDARLPLWLAALIVAAAATIPSARTASYLLALAMGAQNAAATRFGGVPINTAFVTGDIEHLGEAVAEGGGRERARAILSVLLAYALGALLAVLARRHLPLPLLVPAAGLALAGYCAARSGAAASTRDSRTRRPRE